jgi:hypothetical protein
MDYFAVWDTRSSIVDGNYEVKVALTDACSNSAIETRRLVVDNTMPIAYITSPQFIDPVTGSVPIYGIVNDAHLLNWDLSYTTPSTSQSGTIASGTTAVDGLLGIWDTSSLEPGVCSLILTANDQAIVDDNDSQHNQSKTQYAVHIGLKGDLNADRVVNLQDLKLMAENWLMSY